ncbi:MAG: phage major capsid protein [Mycobacteriaceae bacterium]
MAWRKFNSSRSPWGFPCVAGGAQQERSAVVALLTNNDGRFIVPETWATDLITEPVKSQSVASIVAGAYSATGRLLHVPKILEDPSAAWVAEGEEITESTPKLGEITVSPSKVAGIVPVSNEVIADGDVEALNMAGRGLARDIARKVDAAFFGALTAPAPSGLGALAGVSEVDAGAGFGNVDAFLEAATVAAARGTSITAFVAHPDDVLALSRIRKSDGSNESLLETAAPSEFVGTVRTVAGVPLYSSADVAAGTVWGVPKDRVHLALWKDVELVTDTSVFFTRDMSAIRAVMRCAFAFPDPASVVKITVGGGE